MPAWTSHSPITLLRALYQPYIRECPPWNYPFWGALDLVSARAKGFEGLRLRVQRLDVE